jgi:hypothetical protein
MELANHSVRGLSQIGDGLNGQTKRLFWRTRIEAFSNGTTGSITLRDAGPGV